MVCDEVDNLNWFTRGCPARSSLAMPRMMQLCSFVREKSATGTARKLSSTMTHAMANPVLLPSLRPVRTPPMPS